MMTAAAQSIEGQPLTRWHWLVPALLLAAGTMAVWIWDLDHAMARLYYVPNDPTHWPLGYEQPWAFLYRWAVVPAIALGAAGLIALGLSWWPGKSPVAVQGAGEANGARRRAAMRKAGVLITLSLVLGPLLVVNGILHEGWGRPRPRQVVEFAGTKAFQPVLRPAFDRSAQSFPTGHAAGGFSVMILYFVWRRDRPKLAGLALVAALVVGGITAWARIIQGGHWLSDGLWSAGIIWFAAWAVARGLEWRTKARAQEPSLNEGAASSRPIAAVLCLGGAVLLCGSYLALLPIQERASRTIPIAADVHEVQITLMGPPAEVHRLPSTGSGIRITTTLSGRGAPWVALTDAWSIDPAPAGKLYGHYSVEVAGYRRKHNLELWIEAPTQVPVAIVRSAPSQPGAPQK